MSCRLVFFPGDGFVTRAEFDELFSAILPKAQPGSSARAFAALDKEGLGKVDIVSWTHRIRLADMPAMVARIRRHGMHPICAAGLEWEKPGNCKCGSGVGAAELYQPLPAGTYVGPDMHTHTTTFVWPQPSADCLLLLCPTCPHCVLWLQAPQHRCPMSCVLWR